MSALKVQTLDEALGVLMSDVNPLWPKLIEWMVTPSARRGDVSSEAGWAAAHDVTDRTLRRWKQDPRFVEMLEARRLAPVEVSSDTVSSDEADYLQVKSVLVDGARQGNLKSVELYMKTYGKPFVEEEVAARSTDLAGLDLEDLVLKGVLALGPELVADALRGLGWGVVGP